ncbi:Diaminobutyrate decarboxylase [Novosphingobium sp. Rr 2-17]|nr:Diaminobutyrate decarboxylase [Novosphingobium sp. Rr 2-17]
MLSTPFPETSTSAVDQIQADRLQKLTHAFDTADFSHAVAVAHERLAAHLEKDDLEVLKQEPPAGLMRQARALMTKGEGEFSPDRFADILDLYLRTGIQVNSRGYMARQFSSVVPVSAVFDMVSAMAPQPASFYEAGPLPNVADKILSEEFGERLGWVPGSFDMVSTSGASLANLTAVLAARNRHFASFWKGGVRPDSRGRPAVAIGADSHFSVTRIAGILGLGEDQVVRLPVDDRRRISIEGAIAALDGAAERGLNVFCIVAAAGSTSIGANDPLPALAAIARERGAWLHVDAAHNGAFLVSDRLRGRIKGIELADSFCLDAHKTLFMPAACTLLFYRQKGLAGTAFPQKASYVFDPDEDEISRFESGVKNFECTKRPSIVNLWLTWALYGRCFFETKLDYLVELTRIAHDHIASLSDFAVAHEPESNILCFIHRPEGSDGLDINRLQLELRNRVRDANRYFISKVDLDGVTNLRIVMMNHRIDRNDIVGLLEEIRRHGRDIVADWTRQTVAA